MTFLMGLVAFILGSVLIGVCIVAVPGPGGEAPPASAGHGHGGH